jgi:hypothetical protein
MACIACGAGMTRAQRHDRGCGDRAVDRLLIRRSLLADQAGEIATVAAHQLAEEEWHVRVFCAAMGEPRACGGSARSPLSGRSARGTGCEHLWRQAKKGFPAMVPPGVKRGRCPPATTEPDQRSGHGYAGRRTHPGGTVCSRHTGERADALTGRSPRCEHNSLPFGRVLAPAVTSDRTRSVAFLSRDSSEGHPLMSMAER